ncbi:MAG: carbon starvation CstA family protein [Faecousia sp.]
MVTFIICIAALILGYIFYGKRVDKIFGSDDRKTPAITLNDGVDFVPMKGWKSYMARP